MSYPRIIESKSGDMYVVDLISEGNIVREVDVLKEKW